MGKLGTGRNNQLSANGLLYDSDGNVFDLTQWYKDNSADFTHSNMEIQNNILIELKKMNLYLMLMTDEKINNEDIK